MDPDVDDGTATMNTDVDVGDDVMNPVGILVMHGPSMFLMTGTRCGCW